MGCFASSSKMAQDAIKLCRIKMSVAAILYELAGFIANTEKMRIEAEIDPAFREIMDAIASLSKSGSGSPGGARKTFMEMFVAV